MLPLKSESDPGYKHSFFNAHLTVLECRQAVHERASKAYVTTMLVTGDSGADARPRKSSYSSYHWQYTGTLRDGRAGVMAGMMHCELSKNELNWQGVAPGAFRGLGKHV